MWQNFGLLLIINQQGGKKYPTGVSELFELISEKMEFVIHPNLLKDFCLSLINGMEINTPQVSELFELISEKMEFVIHPNLLNNFTVKNYKAQPWAILAEE